MVLFVVEWVVEVMSAVTMCRIASLRSYASSVWSYVDMASNFLIVASIFWWSDTVALLRGGAFDPQQRHEVYDIDPLCPDAHWIRFNNTELAALRTTFLLSNS